MPDNNITQENEQMDEMKKHTITNPFAYEMNDKQKHISLMTQREASYKEPAEETFIPETLGEYPRFWAVFKDNLEAPTPQIMQIDGYKPEEDESSNSGENTDDNCNDDEQNNNGN